MTSPLAAPGFASPARRLATGVLLALLASGCASAPTTRDARWYVTADYAPPTYDPNPALAARLTTQVTWRASESGATYAFPAAMAAECAGPASCRHAAVKTEITVNTHPAGPDRFRVQGQLVATVGRHVVIQTPPGMPGYQRTDYRVNEDVALLAEGVFPTPFDQTVSVGEPLTVPGFHGASVTLRVRADPIATLTAPDAAPPR